MQSKITELLNLVKIKDYEKCYAADIHDDLYFGFPLEPVIAAEKGLLSAEKKPIAYFSMEFGMATSVYNTFSTEKPVKPANKLSENEVFSNDRVRDFLFSLQIDSVLDLPIYSGGLGVLAGDTVKTASDLNMPFVAVGILWNEGYFRQRFWFKFGQLPDKTRWDPTTFPGLIPLENKIKLELKNRDIYLRLWKYYCYSFRKDFAVPLILLDSNLPENDEAARKLTDQLYRSNDLDGRLLQRLVLGMGGMKALEELGYPIRHYHLNEGHAAFAFVEKVRGYDEARIEKAKSYFAYTCHTPVPAGHDRFSLFDLERILKPEDVDVVQKFGVEDAGRGIVNLTILAMNTSSSVNAVSKKHGEVMRLQFPAYADRIKAITNGIHVPTWISESIKKVLDSNSAVIGDYRSDATLLGNVAKLRNEPEFRQAIWEAHQENKKRLARLLYNWNVQPDVFTLCWARRIAAYKRPGLIFQDLEKLRELSEKIGPIQILFAGKAHPNDNLAFTYINDIMSVIDRAGSSDGRLKIIMLENYDIYIAKLLTSGVDVWLNNPLPPYEASGTSGMKAITNGVLQLTTVDGWVVEALDSGIGKFFGFKDRGDVFTDELILRLDEDSRELYGALEDMMRLYYDTIQKGALNFDSRWIDMIINCIIQAGYFNTFRMLGEYRKIAWGKE
ncbi:MAG: alpha-glucan family phosphorylase [Candidatus Omnitrophota bacterium]